MDMQIEISTENLRGSYKKHTEREYCGVYWLNKTGHGPGAISAHVGMNRETVKSVRKKLKISDSPLPLKGGVEDQKKLLRGQGDTLKDSLERTHSSPTKCSKSI
jgi:hypothetical protein